MIQKGGTEDRKQEKCKHRANSGGARETTGNAITKNARKQSARKSPVAPHRWKPMEDRTGREKKRHQTANKRNHVTKRGPATPHCRATLSHTVRQSRIGAKSKTKKKRNRNGNGNGWGRGVATPPTGRGRRRRRLEPKGQPPAAPATAGPPAGLKS